MPDFKTTTRVVTFAIGLGIVLHNANRHYVVPKKEMNDALKAQGSSLQEIMRKELEKTNKVEKATTGIRKW